MDAGVAVMSSNGWNEGKVGVDALLTPMPHTCPACGSEGAIGAHLHYSHNEQPMCLTVCVPCALSNSTNAVIQRGHHGAVHHRERHSMSKG